MTDEQQLPVETAEPETGAYDQTRFAEEAVILPTGTSPGQVVVKKKRSPLIFLLAGLAALSVVAMVVVLTLSQQGSGGNGRVVASPTPIGAPMTQTELERRFSLLADDIEAADPTKGALAFPPVDYSLDLQDATQLKQKLRR